jgi:hypothetical protein
MIAMKSGMIDYDNFITCNLYFPGYCRLPEDVIHQTSLLKYLSCRFLPISL